VNSELPFVCGKKQFTTIDYEQMVMEAQHTDKEKRANSITSDIDSDKESTQKILDT